MRRRYACGTLLAGLAFASLVEAAGDITPGVQAALDKQKAIIATWAAHPTIVKAVMEQNVRGPLAGMDNAKWKVVRRSDPIVQAFQRNAAGDYLRAKLEQSHGLVSEVFLSARQGEKVAFAEKTTWYMHKGMPKFDVPMATKRPWQGQPEFDESSQTYAIQLSVPVLVDGNPIGVLVVGLDLAQLDRAAKQ